MDLRQRRRAALFNEDRPEYLTDNQMRQALEQYIQAQVQQARELSQRSPLSQAAEAQRLDRIRRELQSKVNRRE